MSIDRERLLSQTEAPLFISNVNATCVKKVVAVVVNTVQSFSFTLLNTYTQTHTHTHTHTYIYIYIY